MPAKKFETLLRPLAVMLFLPGFYFVLFLVAVLSLALAALGVRLGMSVALRNPTGGFSVLAAFGISGAVGVFAAVRAFVQSLKAGKIRATALSVKRSEARGVWDSITRISRLLKTHPPVNLILDFGSGFFVTDGVVKTYDTIVAGRTLCISAPLLRVLTVAEFEGVLAHEMAHFTGNDLLYTHYFYPVYRGSNRALSDLHEQASEGGWHALTLFLPMLLVSMYLRLFAHVERKISRIRELRADAMAAEATSPETIAQALAKTYAYAPFCNRTYDWMVRWLKENNAFVNVPAFLVDSLQRDRAALARSLRDSEPLAHPFSTHPTFPERIYALGLSRVEPQFTVSEPAAASLFPALEAFEERLTELRTLEIMKTRPGHFFTKRKQPPYEVMAIC